MTDACWAGELEDLEQSILDLLDQRAPGATICPSEAARRAAAASEDGTPWRELMDLARAAARRLADEGVIEVTQGGQPVDPAAARGPIRLRTATQSRS